MANIVDSISVYMILRKLVTPFIQMPAFHAGVIDEDGNFLVSRSEMTKKQLEACSLLDVLVINMKKIIYKIPGGRTQIASFAAAMFLLRQNKVVTEENLINVLFTLEENYKQTLTQLAEDAPAMSVGSGHIAGIGAKDPFDIAVSKKAQNKYKKQNAMFRRKPVKESTLQYHEQLNPKIWDNMILKPEIRGKLLQIAETWRQFANIPSEIIKDIIITGGNCNYNYTDQSDIDLHLVIDRNLVDPNRALVDDYLQDKKILWTITHPDIHIKGYPVELYAQDLDEQPHEGQGVYSLTNNAWIQAPRYLGLNFENDYHLKKKVGFYADLIDKMISQRADKDTMDQIKKKIRTMRGDSIAQGGEFAFGNLVFKELRNLGYLDKMDDYEKSMQDKALSLEGHSKPMKKFNEFMISESLGLASAAVRVVSKKHDKEADSYHDEGHYHHYFESEHPTTHKDMMDHFKSKGYAIKNQENYSHAHTHEGTYPGTTHRYEIHKDGKKFYVHHDISKEEGDTHHFNNIVVSRDPHLSIAHMKSIPTFGGYIHSEHPDLAKKIEDRKKAN